MLFVLAAAEATGPNPLMEGARGVSCALHSSVDKPRIGANSAREAARSQLRHELGLARTKSLPVKKIFRILAADAGQLRVSY